MIDRIFQAHLEGREHGYAARNTTESPPLDDLWRAQQDVDEWYVAWSDRIAEGAVDERVDFKFVGGGEGSMTRGEIVMHIVNHTSYHRGFVADLFYQIPARPPTTDLTVFLRARGPISTEEIPSSCRERTAAGSNGTGAEARRTGRVVSRIHPTDVAQFWRRDVLVAPDVRRAIARLTEQEFAELLSVAQVLPGAPGVNMAVLIGYRLASFAGAAASLAGFIAAPCVVLFLLATVHARFGELSVMRNALAGMSVVAVGLIIAMAARMSRVLQGRAMAWLFAALAFAGAGLMRWPLFLVLAVLAPFAIAAAWKSRL